MATPLLRYIWASPNTLLGVLIGLLALSTGGEIRIHSGVLEASGGFPSWWLRNATPLPGGTQAITFGHVVIGQNQLALDSTRIHERVHVDQYGRWGPFFLPAYLLSSTFALLGGRDAYRDNLFEREAYRIERERKGSSRRERS